jgi:Tfp pilus assembly protein PilN
MINLLPFQHKKELLLLEKQKMAAILGAMILLSVFCFVLILFAIKIHTDGQVLAQKIFVSVWEKEFKQPEIQELQKKVKSANQTFSRLLSFYEKRFSFAKTTEKIAALLPPDVLLYSLSFGPATKDGVEVSLSGVAPDRETLLRLKNNLENKTEFKDVVFPLSSWVKSTDIDFFVSFKTL